METWEYVCRILRYFFEILFDVIRAKHPPSEPRFIFYKKVVYKKVGVLIQDFPIVKTSLFATFYI